MKARENPFRVDRVLTIRYQPQGWAFDDLLTRLAQLNYRGAIVGPEGSGKTTLLEDLAPHLAKRSLHARYLRLDRDQRSFDPAMLEQFFVQLSDCDVICFDGCEQLPDRAWREFLKRSERAGGLIITTHEPRRLPALVTCSTTPELLSDIIERLVGSDHSIDVHALHEKHRGNIRDALRDLYDRM
jgi:predicted AAA+ superfamily ATPase